MNLKIITLILFTDLLAGALISLNSKMIELPLMLSTLAYALDVAALYAGGTGKPLSMLLSTLCTLHLTYICAAAEAPYYAALTAASAILKAAALALTLKTGPTSLQHRAAPIIKLNVKVKSKKVTVLTLRTAGLARYLKETPQFFFITPSILLLMTAAALLSAGNEEQANNIAVYAYYQLVAGVLAALASTVKNTR